MDYFLYTDGGARGNPGIAGAGAVIYDSAGKVLAESKKPLGETTNNEAEYMGLLLGLGLLKKKLGKAKVKQAKIEVRMDSELVVKQLNGEYQVVDPGLAKLFMKVWNTRVSEIPGLTFSHVRRAKNKRADQLVNQAIDESSLI